MEWTSLKEVLGERWASGIHQKWEIWTRQIDRIIVMILERMMDSEGVLSIIRLAHSKNLKPKHCIDRDGCLFHSLSLFLSASPPLLSSLPSYLLA